MFLSPLGVPLTILQIAALPSHQIDPILVANNFFLGSAIYDADRLDQNSTLREIYACRVSTVLSMVVYASHPITRPLAPVVLALHLAYADVKPYIGPIKPFFVAAFWTIAVYFAPLWWSPDNGDTFTPAAIFLHISALSHLADVKDIFEDSRDGIETPAVMMERPSADAYLIALGLAACYMHAMSPISNVAYDILFLLLLARGVLPDK